MSTDRRQNRPRRAVTSAARSLRGLSMIELLFAMAITVMVAAAIAAMWAAISVGERTRRDNREFTVRSIAAKARISAYIAPSRCVLYADSQKLVLWRDDSRQSGTVHASEIRWLVFDPVRGELNIYFVRLDNTLSEPDKQLLDQECSLTTNWTSLLASYMGQPNASVPKLTLVDGLSAVSLSLDTTPALDAREVTCQMSFATGTAGQTVSQTLSAAILDHVVPGA